MKQRTFGHVRAIATLCGLTAAIAMASAETLGEKDKVIVNGDAISRSDMDAFEMAFGVRIPSGKYWYDRISGAWGPEGKPTAGFTIPGMRLGGQLKENASKGDSGVFVNGRELPKEDVKALNRIGIQPKKNRYWLDAYGNCGLENGPFLMNIVEYARQNGYSGGSYLQRTSGGYVGGDGSTSYFFDPKSGASVMVGG